MTSLDAYRFHQMLATWCRNASLSIQIQSTKNGSDSDFRCLFSRFVIFSCSYYVHHSRVNILSLVCHTVSTRITSVSLRIIYPIGPIVHCVQEGTRSSLGRYCTLRYLNMHSCTLAIPPISLGIHSHIPMVSYCPAVVVVVSDPTHFALP